MLKIFVNICINLAVEYFWVFFFSCDGHLLHVGGLQLQQFHPSALLRRGSFLLYPAGLLLQCGGLLLHPGGLLLNRGVFSSACSTLVVFCSAGSLFHLCLQTLFHSMDLAFQPVPWSTSTLPTSWTSLTMLGEGLCHDQQGLWEMKSMREWQWNEMECLLVAIKGTPSCSIATVLWT